MVPFERNFYLFSYAAVFCGFFALWISGTFGIFESGLFITVTLLAWKLENTHWQISERIGTAMVVLALPTYYLLFQFRVLDFGGRETMLPGLLARLILSLTAIKLMQRKSDRDWMFLYLMAFFELLLAAGLSISVGYVVAFVAFVFIMACTIVLFEIRKTARGTESGPAGQNGSRSEINANIPIRKIVTVSAFLIFGVAAIGVPTFFLLPRVSGAGLGGNAGTVSAISGFSDTVRLGGIGTIQQNDAVVMRVRLENEIPNDIRWRGVALDTFDGLYWSRSKPALQEPKTKNERDLIQVDTARRQEGLTLQTVYLEPLDAPVVFGLYRLIGVQGNFQVLYRDVAGAVRFQRAGDRERVSYKVLSDTFTPEHDRLRSDRTPYNREIENYLQLPSNIDDRIVDLAATVTAESKNRYDASVATEQFLQTQFGYTLDQKAGGRDPLSAFLFDVREGHCEYFATAMAVMLRTQGIATRVVNGFQRGDYNDTADVFVVRQRNAHSWVEVYFPETDSWVTFDPTPPAGQNTSATFGAISDRFRKYVEALETFWIQYFVAFDNQEQRSLFVSMRRQVYDYQSGLSSFWNVVQGDLSEWWNEVRGEKGLAGSFVAISWAVAMLAIGFAVIGSIVWLSRKVVKLKFWLSIRDRLFGQRHPSAVEFYERMLRILEARGLARDPFQTPLEFAYAIDMPPAVKITEKYNRVRFGDQFLTSSEADEVDDWLNELQGRSETTRIKNHG